MTISLRPEHERLTAEAIRAGLIRIADEAFDNALEDLRHRLQVHNTESSIAQIAERLATFGKRHNLSLDGLKIKDLINEGRG